MADDFTACQELASRWRSDGSAPAVFFSPSAALPGTKSLVILGPRVAIPYAWELINPFVQGAAGPTTGSGVATIELVGAVRYRGSSHPELEAWKAGHAFACPLSVAGSPF